ncbi:MAG: hypothetical protein NT099_00185 [Candidatus Saganbacteria bacterium]|nr:hypothetical protein [Candidatus Saganbacteria bacterium]
MGNLALPIEHFPAMRQLVTAAYGGQSRQLAFNHDHPNSVAVVFYRFARRYGVESCANPPCSIYPSVVGKQYVTYPDAAGGGHVICTDRARLIAFAAFDLIDDLVAVLDVKAKMPKTEKGLLDLVHAVFSDLDPLPDESIRNVPDGVLEAIAGKVIAAASALEVKSSIAVFRNKITYANVLAITRAKGKFIELLRSDCSPQFWDLMRGLKVRTVHVLRDSLAVFKTAKMGEASSRVGLEQRLESAKLLARVFEEDGAMYVFAEERKGSAMRVRPGRWPGF